VLFNQFHDILPGSGVRQTRDHALGLFQEVGAITGSIKREAIKAFTSRIDTQSLIPDTREGAEERNSHSVISSDAGHGIGGSVSGLSETGGYGRRYRPYVVFNSCAWERSERVNVSIYDSGFDPSQIVAVDNEGVARPILLLNEIESEWGHKRLVVAFDALDVPAMGYRTYILCERQSLSPATIDATAESGILCANFNSFETPFVQFRVDQEQGGVTDLIDKRSGAKILPNASRTPLGSFGYVTEEHYGSAWVLGRELEPPTLLKTSSFRVLGRKSREGTGEIEPKAPGGCQTEHVFKVPGTTSGVKLSMSVNSIEPRLDFTAEVDWREIGSPERGIPGLLVQLPLGFSSIKSSYEIPFGSIERDLFDGDETPALRFAHVEGTARTKTGESVFAGLTLVQDCKYGHSIVGNDEDGYVLRLRIVRSTFGPDPTPEIAATVTRFSVYFHDRPADPADLAKLGANWNHPLIATPVGVHGGDLPVKQGFVRVLTPGVTLTALKIAESGEGLILRLAELNGDNAVAVVEIAEEISRGFTKAMLADAMERPVEGSASWEGNRVVARIAANSFTTILIR
jgi:alpha-mannosidase